MDPLQQQTVLVVDDVPENIDVLAGILRPHLRVKAATSGAKALSLARSGTPPDLILLDIMMPGMSGYEVCAALKSDLSTCRIPVIFVTAIDEIEDERRGFEMGAVDYITKPVSPPLVLARVRSQLALHNQRLELWKQVQSQTAELTQTRLSIIRCLGRAAEYKDDQTGHHVLRMASYSKLLAAAIGMAEQEVDLLFQAAPMHDIGKIGTPDHILKKPGKLDAEEWRIMQMHVLNGAQILGDSDSELLKLARRIVLSHHEKWDGSGYPAALRGELIPLEGRIVALADVFDALVSARPYKAAWPIARALEFIESQAGQHFDPGLVPHFLRLVPQLQDIGNQFSDPPKMAAESP